MQVATSRSQVCQRLRYMRVLAPVSALVLVLAQQVFEHTVLMGLPTFQHFMTQVVFYAVTVPVALWLLVNWMLERVEQPAAGEAGGRSDPLAGLTRREMEVADLMARGCTNREIATELTVSPETVKAHVRHILRKLDMHYRGGVRELLMDSRWVLD